MRRMNVQRDVVRAPAPPKRRLRRREGARAGAFSGADAVSVCALLLIAGCGARTAPEAPAGKSLPAAPSVYQANGIKIGEVTQTTAIVWTRLTRNPERKRDGVPWPKVKRKKRQRADGQTDYEDDGPQMPEGHSLDEMQDSVPGAPGLVQVVCWPDGVESGVGQAVLRPAPEAVDTERDFSAQFALTGLESGTRYRLRVESSVEGTEQVGHVVEGRFRTAPAKDDPARVVFTVVTGQGFRRRDDEENGHAIYPKMASLDPDFFIHTGDILYYDRGGPVATSIDLARFKWNSMYALPFQRAFHNRVAAYFIKDDHDTWQNDCWPSMKNDKMGDFTFEQGLGVFLEQVPMGERTYRTVRWGKDLQVWFVEGRDFRSPNPMPDGPAKTIWGREQKEWFFRTVRESDATFRILASPTPLVGPDREKKNDNHSNAGFATEGRELRSFIASQRNMVVVCGDRHWQYASVDPETGLREYSCGPTSEKHAGGWKQANRMPEHRYLGVCGGFLSGTVERVGERVGEGVKEPGTTGKPTLTFRHHGVDGKVLHQDRLTAE